MAGLTSTGFQQKTFDQIKTELQQEAKNQLGSTIDISDQSGIGVLINVYAQKDSVGWEQLNSIFSSRDPDSAEGISLDKIVKFLGIERLSATPTTVAVLLRGTNGTIVPINHQMEKSETKEVFQLQTDTTISVNTAIRVDISITSVVDSTNYTIGLDGTLYTHNSGVGATATSIMTGLAGQVNGGTQPITLVDNLNGSGYLIADVLTTSFAYTNPTANINLVEVGSNGTYQAVIAGLLQVLVGELVTILQPVSGLNSASNLIAGTSGRNTETDAELRERRRTAQQQTSGGTELAIKNGLLQNVSGVTTVLIESNRSDLTVGIRPPHSFETVVAGGTDTAVATEILKRAPAGIEFAGTTTVPTPDSQGVNVNVKFSRSTPKYLWVRYNYSLNTEETFPTNGETLMKNAIVTFGQTEYTIGKDIIIQKLYTPIYSVQGVKDITSLEIAVTNLPTDTPTYSSVDITLAFAEQAIASVTRITVTQV